MAGERHGDGRGLASLLEVAIAREVIEARQADGMALHLENGERELLGVVPLACPCPALCRSSMGQAMQDVCECEGRGF